MPPPTLSAAHAAVLLHEHGTDNVALLRSHDVSNARIQAWKGRATGTNKYFNLNAANDVAPVENTEFTEEEMYCMHVLKSKECTMGIGHKAAWFFPGRTGLGLQKLVQMMATAPNLPPSARMTMPRPAPAWLTRIPVPPGGVQEGAPARISASLAQFLDYGAAGEEAAEDEEAAELPPREAEQAAEKGPEATQQAVAELPTREAEQAPEKEPEATQQAAPREAEQAAGDGATDHGGAVQDDETDEETSQPAAKRQCV